MNAYLICFIDFLYANINFYIYERKRIIKSIVLEVLAREAPKKVGGAPHPVIS